MIECIKCGAKGHAKDMVNEFEGPMCVSCARKVAERRLQRKRIDARTLCDLWLRLYDLEQDWELTEEEKRVLYAARRIVGATATYA